MVAFITVAKLSAVTGTEAPEKTSWQVCGTVSPMVVAVERVQATAVLTAAVALLLGVLCANAEPAATKLKAQANAKDLKDVSEIIRMVPESVVRMAGE
jgi:hypothetical protein